MSSPLPDTPATVPGGSADDALSLFLAGDLMTGRGVDQILPHSVDPELHEDWVKDARTYVRIAREAGSTIPDEVPFSYVWGDALGELAAMDPGVRIVNLETAVTTADHPWPGKAIHYRMHPDNVPVLTAGGVDVAVLANNHVLDWGRDGLWETLRVLRGAGLATAGAGMDRSEALAPASVTTPGGRALVFAYGSPSAGVFPAWTAGPERAGVAVLSELGASGAERVAADVAARRVEGDRVVVSVHWGGNWGYPIPDEQRDFARRLIDAGGADIVVGHSSHHPKGIEVHAGRLILYGTGDLLNDYEGIGRHGAYRGELTLMYFPTLGPGGELRRLVMTPMRIRDFRLRDAGPEDTTWLAETLGRECRDFGSAVREGDDGRLHLEWG